MPLSLAWFIASILILLIALMAYREFRAYRFYETTRQDLYPYSRRRLTIRLAISGLLALIALLLLPGPYWVPRKNSHWFLVYLFTVLSLVALTVILAWLDWRESRRLYQLSKKRLLDEFVHEVRSAPLPRTSKLD